MRLSNTHEYRKAHAIIIEKMNSLYGVKWKNNKKNAKRIKYAIRAMAKNEIGEYPSILDFLQDWFYKILHYKKGIKNEK